MTVSDVCTKHPDDYADFLVTRKIDVHSDLYEELYLFYSSNRDMPYGIANAVSGEPAQWITDKLLIDLGY